MKEQTEFKNRFFPVLSLVFISTFIPEILMGSTPLSRANEWPVEFVFYGSAALLIREMAFRYKTGWVGVFLAGIAFGLFEEGFVLQSIFNPEFLGNNLTFGRVFGTNVVWAQFIVGYHAIFSITIPILFTEIIFPKQKFTPWLSKTGLWIFTVLFVLSSIFLYLVLNSFSGFNSLFLLKLIVLIIIALIIFLTFKFKPGFPTGNNTISVSPVISGLASFIACLLWLAGLYPVFMETKFLPPWSVHLAGLAVLVFAVIIAKSWLNHKWTKMNQFAFISGGLVAGMIHGSNIVFQSGNRMDIYFQIIFITVTVLFLSISGIKIWESE
ncbi:MAG: hypothetical protein JW833_04520 [Prolixibacteraceae bacterium]|nr:hypothetical protein [Prolixibacteraceae bacterium]